MLQLQRPRQTLPPAQAGAAGAYRPAVASEQAAWELVQPLWSQAATQWSRLGRGLWAAETAAAAPRKGAAAGQRVVRDRMQRPASCYKKSDGRLFGCPGVKAPAGSEGAHGHLRCKSITSLMRHRELKAAHWCLAIPVHKNSANASLQG